MKRLRIVEVFRAFERGQLRQIGLSAEQVRRLLPEAAGPGWVIESAQMKVGEAEGIVVDWGSGREHVHWQCPLCGREHVSDFDPHADTNPVLWFCEIGGPDEICLVNWRRDR